MPEHLYSTNDHDGHIRTKVIMRRGEVISLCRCWRSKIFPLCDGSHNNINDEKGPVIIRIDCDSDFLTKKEN